MNYLYTLIVLQVLDALTTYWIIRKGGHEMNPVLIWLAEKLKRVTNAKWAWLVIAKLSVAGMAVAAFPYMDEWLKLALCGFYVLVVVWNFVVIERFVNNKGD